jgi:hypothetical protein
MFSYLREREKEKDDEMTFSTGNIRAVGKRADNSLAS